MKALTGIAAAEFARRRRQLMRMAGEDAILVLPAAPERVRSHDTHYPYRQDSDFWYLSGFPEPDAVLVLVPGRKHGEAILFCRERDPEREGWDGPRAGQDGAVNDYGMDDAYPIDDLDEILPGLLEGRSRVYYHFGRDADFDLKLIGWVRHVRAHVKQGAQPPHEFLELGHLLHELRLFKSKEEIKLMRRAADISVHAHRAAMRVARPGIREYELQADLERVFRAHDAWPAYNSIVGAGRNACVLHYRANTAQARDGDLVLIDAGAEYRGYAADITRTFPTNGKFTDFQKKLYQAVLDSQQAGFEAAKPGATYSDIHHACMRVIAERLHDWGILPVDVEESLSPEGQQHRRWLACGVAHHLGLDVHDCAQARYESYQNAKIRPGMIFTIEPGLYVSHDDTTVDAKWRGIGIRTEDDVLVTAEGPVVLTDALARSADEIEALMAAR